MEELNDALSPLYDRLVLSRAWWVLELVPLIQMRQRACYEPNAMSDIPELMINGGRGRQVCDFFFPHAGPLISCPGLQVCQPARNSRPPLGACAITCARPQRQIADVRAADPPEPVRARG
jgi:hypothetical protein